MAEDSEAGVTSLWPKGLGELDRQRPGPKRQLGTAGDRYVIRGYYSPGDLVWRPSATSDITFNISGGTFSQLNPAVETVQSIANSLTAISENFPDLAKALQELGQAVLDAASLDEQRRTELVENIDDLSEQARHAPEQRKRGRLRAAIDAISAVATPGTQLHTAWDAWGPTIQQLVPR